MVKVWAKRGRNRGRADKNTAICSPLFADSDLFDEVDNPPSQLGVADAHEGFGERQAIRGGEKIRNVSRRGRLAQSVRPRRAGNAWRAFEEERHRHLQDQRDLLQAAGADAVRSLLVFLDLLKSQAEVVAELLL